MIFNTIEAFIDYSTHRLNKGRFGLDHFKQAMESLGNPQLKLNCVHIAGTNGKGSTTNYLRSMFQQAGYRVGSFTSPHLEVHNDRIRIQDIFISDEDLLNYGNRFYPLIEAYHLSMFEIDVLIAVQYFLDNKVDLALFEVGLGGRLDATNIIDPLVSVITTIGYDHMEYLGTTLEEIAYEKAGIIKFQRPVFTAEPKLNCLAVFDAKAKAMQTTCILIDEPQNITHHPKLEFVACGLQVKLNTLADYQVRNAALALRVAFYLNDHGYPLKTEAMSRGLYETQWKGRFEVMSQSPLVIIDGAHNTHGMDALLMSVKALPSPKVVVFSALKDKDTDSMVEALMKAFDQVIVTHFDFYRASSLEDLAKAYPVLKIEDPEQALRKGLELSKEGCLVITGSLYFISQVRQSIIPNLRKEKLL